jgi:hypothetical protein
MQNIIDKLDWKFGGVKIDLEEWVTHAVVEKGLEKSNLDYFMMEFEKFILYLHRLLEDCDENKRKFIGTIKFSYASVKSINKNFVEHIESYVANHSLLESRWCKPLASGEEQATVDLGMVLSFDKEAGMVWHKEEFMS